MILTVKKWGNSQGIRIPKNLLEKLEIEVNDEIDLNLIGDAIVIKPTNKKRKNIIELFDGYTGDFKCEEIDWGEAQGAEVW